MKILVTGFKPFLGETINPSEIHALELSENFSEVDALILPVEFVQSFELLNSHVLNNQYDFIIMLGQAAGRNKISLERIALNWIQTKNSDESGILPKQGLIVENSPLAIMTLFPIDDLYENLINKNLPVEISLSAGGFVCNELYYKTCATFNNIKSIFIHVPLVKNQLSEKNSVYLDLEEQRKVLTECISYVLTNEQH